MNPLYTVQAYAKALCHVGTIVTFSPIICFFYCCTKKIIIEIICADVVLISINSRLEFFWLFKKINYLFIGENACFGFMQMTFFFNKLIMFSIILIRIVMQYGEKYISKATCSADDLTSSTNSVMELLASLVSTPAGLSLSGIFMLFNTEVLFAYYNLYLCHLS